MSFSMFYKFIKSIAKNIEGPNGKAVLKNFISKPQLPAKFNSHSSFLIQVNIFSKMRLV